MDSNEAATAWVQAWSAGWARHDPEVIGLRYADDCEFISQPFREALRGRDGARTYAAQAFAEERSARFRFGEPIVGSDRRAAVEYWAIITDTNGEVVTLAGVTVLRFDPEGRVLEHRDHWAMSKGEREPPPSVFGQGTI
jgi:nuclear transport factor 2 (NTF2) superfamily protein